MTDTTEGPTIITEPPSSNGESTVPRRTRRARARARCGAIVHAVHRRAISMARRVRSFFARPPLEHLIGAELGSHLGLIALSWVCAIAYLLAGMPITALVLVGYGAYQLWLLVHIMPLFFALITVANEDLLLVEP